MGGKNAVIVLPDADLDHAARLTAAGAMRYAGQKCTATSRAIVAHEVEGAFIERPRAQIDALPLGPVTDAACADGPFVIRIRESPGFIVPPHSHSVDEHITVVQGTWYYGIGEVFDSTRLQALPAGSYAFATAGTMMFAYSPEPAVVQVHGIGPFDTHWKHGMISLEDADADTVFRFRMGEMVSTPRGDGRIRWGGASGKLIQYDIERADGSVFAVREHEVRRP